MTEGQKLTDDELTKIRKRVPTTRRASEWYNVDLYDLLAHIDYQQGVIDQLAMPLDAGIQAIKMYREKLGLTDHQNSDTLNLMQAALALVRKEQ